MSKGYKIPPRSRNPDPDPFSVPDETMVNRAGLTHWSRQERLIPSSRASLAGSPVG
ncbi:hypothetical protein Hanom_Chr00s175271g01830251 [Helianthus anomalus]